MPISQNANYYRYRYIPKDVVLILDKAYYFRDGTITYINILFDYVGCRIPIIQGGIECDSTTIREIYKHRDVAKMKIAIDEQKIGYEDEILNTTRFINASFNLIPARDQTVYITDGDVNAERRNDNMKLLQHFEFYLVDLEVVKMFDAERNFSAKDTTFPAMLQSLFMARNIRTDKIKIVATPPTQDLELKTVTLPLNTLIGNIKYFNTKYGLYDGNPIIFYDMKYLYCLNKRNPNTQMPDTATDFGTVTFTVYNPDDEHHNIHGSCDDMETSTHFINLERAPAIRDTSMQDNYTKASTIATVDKDGTVKTQSIDDVIQELDRERIEAANAELVENKSSSTSSKGGLSNLVANKLSTVVNTIRGLLNGTISLNVQDEIAQGTKIVYVYNEHELSMAQVINELITGPTVDVVAKEISVKFLRPYKDYNFQLDTSYTQLNLEGKVFRLLSYSINIHRDGSSSYLNEVSMTLYSPDRDIRETEVNVDTTNVY